MDQSEQHQAPHQNPEMPRYRCHKEVHALKIKGITTDAELALDENRETDGTATLVFDSEEVPPLKVSAGYYRKHAPVAGGYYVVYNDGYASFSPGKVFEDGYTRLGAEVNAVPSAPASGAGTGQSTLRLDLERIINTHSAENGSNTPDFILARFLLDALVAFDASVRARETWYGRR